ncbi:MAG TPA: ABC transporter substrate-binding protein [Actinomycetales bacterium]|nr:ABC transporter substrate-binding protein [Actinomycetales bacterium]
MKLHSAPWRLAAGAALVSIVLVGCRSSGDDPAEPAGGGEEGSEEIATDIGVTSEPCPDAVNADNGCIYLGTISDLTVGPFAPLAVPITDAQAAFWQRVNEDGGIGGYDIDVTTYVADNLYQPEVHNQVYQEMKDEILAMAQTLGSPTTATILDDLEASDIVAAPASWTSEFAFTDVIVESGANYCAEAMNAIDYAVENFDAQSVMAVAYPGDYGGDAAAGAKVAADANGLEFTNVETGPGADNQAGAIDAIVSGQPDVVMITTAPGDLAVIIGQSAARGYAGKFIGSSPTWNPALLQSPAAPAIEGLFLHAGPWGSFDSDTPGHQAMREAVGDVPPNDGYTSGWAWSYPLRAALEVAVENGDLTRAGLVEAVQSLESVDYEGMLPEGSGNFAGEPNDAVVRSSLISQPSAEGAAGLVTIQEFFEGPTVSEYVFEGSCYTTVDMG